MESSNCLFCKIIQGKIPSKKVYEDRETFAFEDINPQAPTHIQIVPKQHIARIYDIDDSTSYLVGKLTQVANKIAAERELLDGYRLVINCNPGAGQTVYHIHLHLLGGRPFKWPPG